MKRWLLSLLLMLFVGISMFAQIPAAYAFDGDYRLAVKLSNPRTDVTVVATRKGTSLTPTTVPYHFNAGTGQWETDQILHTNGDTCNLDRDSCTWSVSVKDATGKEIGNQAFTFVTGHGITNEIAGTFNIAVPAAGAPCTTGTIHGHVSFVDYRDGNTLKNGPPTLPIDVTEDGGSHTYKTTPDLSGNYVIHNVAAPAAYTVHAHGGYQNPANMSDGLPIDINSVGNKLAACADIAVDLKQEAPAGSDAAVPPEPPKKCDAGKGFTWIICGGIRTMVGAIDWIRDSVIVPFLQEKPLDKDADKDVMKVYTVWSGFRNIASVLFILVFFVIIFGTALGFDNYTVKKSLPRLIAAAVLVPLSWYVCVLLVDSGNILGQGLVAFTSTVIPASTIDFTSSISKLLLGGMLVAGAAAAFGALATIGLGIVVSMLMAFLMVFLTLVLRKILITLMIILSPFAFIAWILPNTEKWYKEWWTNFFKLVMMYPIIMLMFEAGRLFSATAAATAGNAAVEGVTPFFQLVALTLPLFGVPFAFKWAGSGLQMGNKAIGKATGAINKRYGKDSKNAKERAEQRKLNSARRALDTSNPMNSKTLGALKRGINMKRSGLGGFMGGSNIPLLRNSAAKKVRVNAAAAKAEKEEAESDAIDKLRKEQPQSSAERIANKTEAAYSKLEDERIKAALLSVADADGVKLKDIPLTSGSKEDSENIATARTAALASGDASAVVAALKASSGGVDRVEGIIMEQMIRADGPDKAIVTAGLQKLSGSQSGIDRAVELGSGRIRDVKDGTRTTGYAGGGGFNEDGTKALFGGSDTSNVSDEWKDVWAKGMKSAKSMDTNKPMVAAATDFSAEDIAGASPPMLRRLNAFIDRNQTGPLAKIAETATEHYNAAAAGVLASPVLSGKILTDSKTAIATASTLDNPVIAPALGARYASMVTTPPPPPQTPEHVASQIIQATGGNIIHASQIHQEITNQIAATGSSTIQTQIESHILKNGPQAVVNLADVGAPTAPAPLAPGEVAMEPAIAHQLTTQFKTNLDALNAAERSYATNPEYRSVVKTAYLQGTKIPAPPPPPAAPPTP